MANQFEGMFATPTDIRTARINQLQAQQMRTQQLGGSWDGLLGQVAAGQGALIAESLAGVLGMKTAEEKQAEDRQNLLGSIDTTDLGSIETGIEAAQKAGLTKVAEYLGAKKLSLVESAQKQNNSDREYALKWAAEKRLQGATDAEIRLTLAKADELDAMLPLEVRLKKAQAVTAETEAEVAQATMQESIQLVQTELGQALADLGLTEANTEQVNQNIAYAEQLQPGRVEELKLNNEATGVASELNRLQVLRDRELMPFEIAKASLTNTQLMEQTEKIKADTLKVLGDMNKPDNTDFLLELDRAFQAGAIDKETRKQLLADRATALGKTGGVAGIDIQDAATTSRVNKLIEASEGLAAAADAETLTTQMFEVSKELTSGVARDVRSGLNIMLVKMGYGDSAQAAADEMYTLLYGDAVLDKASYMKGALSNADVQFLRESVANTGQSAVGLQTALVKLAASKSAEASYARTADYIITNATGEGSTQQAAALGSSTVKQAIRDFSNIQYLVNASKSTGYKGVGVTKLVSAANMAKRQKAMDILGKAGLLKQVTVGGKTAYSLVWE